MVMTRCCRRAAKRQVTMGHRLRSEAKPKKITVAYTRARGAGPCGRCKMQNDRRLTLQPQTGPQRPVGKPRRGRGANGAEGGLVVRYMGEVTVRS